LRRRRTIGGMERRASEGEAYGRRLQADVAGKRKGSKGRERNEGAVLVVPAYRFY
jgi:hypothetical protein